MRPFVVFAFCVVLLQREASSQRCDGFGSFEAGPVQASVLGSSTRNAVALGVGLGLGTTTGFGHVGAARVRIDRPGSLPITVIGVSGTGALQYVLAGDRLHVCPMVSVGLVGRRPPIARTLTTAFHMAAGVVAMRSDKFEVIPAVAISYARATAKIEDTFSSYNVTDSFWAAGLGLGFVFGGDIALRPGVSVPIEGGVATLSLTCAVTF